MDAPIWSNDLLYVRELIIISLITVAMIGVCFYYSKKSDRRHALRMSQQHESSVSNAPHSATPVE